MDAEKRIAVAINKNGFMNVDRYVNDSSIAEQTERVMNEIGMNAVKVTIETGNSTYYLTVE